LGDGILPIGISNPKDIGQEKQYKIEGDVCAKCVNSMQRHLLEVIKAQADHISIAFEVNGVFS
jgi:hypothetical protein